MSHLPQEVLLLLWAEQAPAARPLPRVQGARQQQGGNLGNGGRRLQDLGEGRRRLEGQAWRGRGVVHLPEVRAVTPPRLIKAAQRELRHKGVFKSTCLHSHAHIVAELLFCTCALICIHA